MVTETKQIIEKLDSIKAELDFIKEHIVDIDRVMLNDDIESLHAAEKDFKTGKTKRL